MNYDYVIIGAGPSGLTLAYLLGQYGKKCAIIDKNNSVGGCNRVTRVNGLFSEHGPRIYSSSYINTKMLLTKMNSSFKDLFTTYKFSISNIGGETFLNLKSKEIRSFVYEFIKLIFISNHGRNTSLKEFVYKKNFSQNSIEYVDRLCRLTDGAGIERYSLFQFLQLANQQAFYKLYQPNKPNDKSLLTIFLKAIQDTGNVDVILNTEITKLNYNSTTDIISSVDTGSDSISGSNFILAIPPKNMLSLLQNSGSSVLNTFGDISTWTLKNSYSNVISVVFHWDTKLDLSNVWGFPKSDWGIAFVVLSDYMEFENPNSKTVISTGITYVNRKSSTINKTANEVEDKEELVQEVFRQLKISFKDLPEPTQAFPSPSVYREDNKWIESDTAYFMDSGSEFLPSKGNISNLFNVGTQNGNSFYSFTSFESAVSNSIKFVHELIPGTKKHFPLRKPFELSKLIIIIFILVLTLIITLTVLYFRKK